jgi:integrase
MARTAKNQKLDTRSARARLAPSKSGYWTPISRGCALGYRKASKGGGTWLARIIRPGLRREIAIGPADDFMDANGATILDYGQAQAKARQWFAEAERADGTVPSGPYTVADALDDYLAEYQRRNGKAVRDAQWRINALIKPQLGQIRVADLTTAQIRKWHADVAAAPPRLRTRKGAEKQNVRRLASKDTDALRGRRATANRVLSILKAALNHAIQEHRVASDDAWRHVKPFREADAPKIRYLSAEEAKRLVNNTSVAFRPMVQAALLTGCRYGELSALRVSDFDSGAGTVTVRTGKTGKPRHVVLTDDGIALFERQTAKKPGDAIVFPRPDGHAWGRSHQHRPLREACLRAKIAPAASFHILRHTYATALLRGGAPLPVIAANLGHADTRMTERHYAHLAPSYVADAIRSAMPSLGIVESDKIRPIGVGRKATSRKAASNVKTGTIESAGLSSAKRVLRGRTGALL